VIKQLALGVIVALFIHTATMAQTFTTFTIKEIIVTGSERTQPSVINYFSDFKPDKMYTKREINDEIAYFKQRLLNSKYFDDVSITTTYNDAQAIITVDIIDAFEYKIGNPFGIQNFNGLGEDYTISFINNTIGTNVKKRGLFTENGLFLGTMSVEYQPRYKLTNSDNKIDFIRPRIEAYWGTRMGFDTAGVFIGIQSNMYRNVSVDSSYNTEFEKNLLYEYLGIKFTHSYQNDANYPSKGSRWNVTGKYATIGYTQLDLDFNTISELNKHFILESTIGYGIQSKNTPLIEKYRLNNYNKSQNVSIKLELGYLDPDTEDELIRIVPCVFMNFLGIREDTAGFNVQQLGSGVGATFIVAEYNLKCETKFDIAQTQIIFNLTPIQ
jgi:Surface antigen variable number repeat